MRRTGRLLGWASVVVVLAGCQMKRVEDEKTISLNPKDVQPVMVVPAQPKDMPITVTAATTPAVPVTLYLAATADADNVMNDLTAGRDSSKVIAKSSPGESPTLTATAPANKDCTVIAVSGGAKTEVKAHIVGKY